MMLRAILLTLLVTFGDTQRSQGRVQYSDARGDKLDWRLFQRNSQPAPNLSQFQHSQRHHAAASTEPKAVLQPSTASPPSEPKAPEAFYQPYSHIPSSLRQLLAASYEPQKIYVDHEAYLRPSPATLQEKSSKASRRVPAAKFYVKGNPNLAPTIPSSRTAEESPAPPQRDVAIDGIDTDEFPTQRRPSAAQPTFDADVPMEIQELLRYQAEIPYDVIANRITYRPQTPFIPEPIARDNSKGYHYPSKIYYMSQNGDVVAKSASTKPMREKPPPRE